MGKYNLINKLSDGKETFHKILAEEFQKLLEIEKSVRPKTSLGEHLAKEFLKEIGESLDIAFIDLGSLSKREINQIPLSIISSEVKEKHNIIPIKKEGDKLWVAMANPFDIIAVNELRELTGCRIQPILAVESQIKTLTERLKNTAMYKEVMGEKKSKDSTLEENLDSVLNDLSEILSPNEIATAKAEIKGINYELGRMNETTMKISGNYCRVHTKVKALVEKVDRDG